LLNLDFRTGFESTVNVGFVLLGFYGRYKKFGNGISGWVLLACQQGG